MQNTEPSESTAAMHLSSIPPEGDEVHYVEMDLFRTNEAKEEEAQVDESDNETNPMLKGPTTRQGSIGIRMTESPTDPAGGFWCISDGSQQTILIEEPPLEFVHSSGKSLLNLISIHRDLTISFIGVLTLKW